MKQFKDLTKELEAFHAKVQANNTKGEPTEPLDLDVHEECECGDDCDCDDCKAKSEACNKHKKKTMSEATQNAGALKKAFNDSFMVPAKTVKFSGNNVIVGLNSDKKLKGRKEDWPGMKANLIEGLSKAGFKGVQVKEKIWSPRGDVQPKPEVTLILKKPLKETLINEAVDDAEDLFTAIIVDDKFTVRHIDPLLKTSRKKQLKSWEKVAELGAKVFAKKVKLPDDWDFLFPKKTRQETAKKLMKHFT